MQSGALITANFAAEQGRDLYAVPGSILHPGSAGCNELIRQGAIPLLSPGDLLEQLNVSQFARQQQVRTTIPANPQETALLMFLSSEPQHIDDIVRSSGIPFPAVRSLLAIREMKWLVQQAAAMSYIRR